MFFDFLVYLDLTQIPEFSHLPDWWNKRARGLGGTLHIPVSCGGEENLLCLREDRYYGDDIFFHETAHAVAVSRCLELVSDSSSS